MREKVPCECGGLKDYRAKRCFDCRSKFYAGSGNPNYKHGQTVNKNQSKTYMVWAEMISRCMNKNHKAYINYGYRGISISKKWMNFEDFFNDMGVAPKNLSLERIDNNGNYCKSNCKWATVTEQQLNRREIFKNKTSKYKGVYWHKRDEKWCVSITRNKKHYYGGCFYSEYNAKKEYEKLLRKISKM